MNQCKNLFLAIFCLVFVSCGICAVENLEDENCCSKPCSVGRSNLPLGFEESISFSGAAFYYFYQLGVASYLQENYDLSKVCFSGASSGSLPAIFLACDINIRETLMEEWVPLMYEILKSKTTGVYFNIFEVMKCAASMIFAKSDYKKASGRVKFPLTNVNSWWPKAEYIDTFSSNEDLIEAAFASAHLPFIVDGYLFANFNDEQYIDGGFVDYQPIFDENTIKVSRYMWSYIYGNLLSPLSWLSLFGNTSKKRNQTLFNDGYHDARKHPEHWARLERFRK
jgi:hypothetical protein